MNIVTIFSKGNIDETSTSISTVLLIKYILRRQFSEMLQEISADKFFRIVNILNKCFIATYLLLPSTFPWRLRQTSKKPTRLNYFNFISKSNLLPLQKRKTKFNNVTNKNQLILRYYDVNITTLERNKKENRG